VAVLLLVGAVVAGQRTDEPGRDLAPLVPIAQKRIVDYRYYGGPQANSFVLSPDGKLAVGSTGGNTLMVYDLSRSSRANYGRTIQVDNPNFYRPVLAFTGDGKTLVGMSNNYPDLNLHFWDVATGKEIRQIDNDQPFGSLALSPDSRLLAVASNQGQGVEIWDAATTEEVARFPGQVNQVFQAVAFSPDGRMLAAGTTDVVHVWEVASGKERTLLRLSPGQPSQIGRAHV